MRSEALALVAGSLVLLCAAEPLFAQPATPPTPVSRPLSIGASGGLGGAMMTRGGTFGGDVVFDATDRIAIEGRGQWLQQGGGASGLDLSGTMLLTILRGEQASAYVGIGGGLYRARIDLGSRRMFGDGAMPFARGDAAIPLQTSCGSGMMNSGSSCGTTWVGTGTGITYNMGEMPLFYASRIGQVIVPVDGRWSTRSFTDPTMSLGFGARVDITDRFYVRPDARALVVFGGGSTLTVGTFTVGFGARF